MHFLEVFADIVCPFTHVGLRRLTSVRDERSTGGPTLVVRAWPLELVNGQPLEGKATADKIRVLQATVAPDLFEGFQVETFPATSLPALAMTAAAYRRSPETGEAVSLELRRLLFEDGVDVSDVDVLRELAGRHALGLRPEADRVRVLADWEDGRARGVVGSPHFFTSTDDFFCPSLDISHPDGRLEIEFDEEGFRAFMAAVFGESGRDSRP